MDAPLPSGEQFEIVAGDYRAVAVGAGGGLRTLTHAERPLVEGYSADALADGGRGQVLAPWPNRVRDGQWTWGDKQLQLALSEPKKGNASHGLVRWAGWGATERGPDRAVLTHRLHPHPGYPFTLDLAITYTVHADDGLTVELVATNPGPGPAPVALGMHPYLAVPGGGLVDGCTLQVPARTRVIVDERSIPIGTEPVEGTPYDLRSARLIGDLSLDTAYTDLEPDGDGRVRVLLGARDGTGIELWTQEPAHWVQVFTGDSLPAARRRRGVAVEPMTAPANALASGEGLTVLEPRQSLALVWGIVAR
jgi:aldose 1-epimerase